MADAAPNPNNAADNVNPVVQLPPQPQQPIIPPIPPEPAAAFVHVLQYIIGLDTPAKRDRVTNNGGVRTIDDILLVDMDSLLECLTATTTVMAKNRLKTLKLWAEEQYDIGHTISIADFTEQACREKQMKIAKATAKTKSSGSDSTSTGKEKLRNFNGKRKNWTNAKPEQAARNCSSAST